MARPWPPGIGTRQAFKPGFGVSSPEPPAHSLGDFEWMPSFLSLGFLICEVNTC